MLCIEMNHKNAVVLSWPDGREATIFIRNGKGVPRACPIAVVAPPECRVHRTNRSPRKQPAAVGASPAAQLKETSQ